MALKLRDLKIIERNSIWTREKTRIPSFHTSQIYNGTFSVPRIVYFIDSSRFLSFNSICRSCALFLLRMQKMNKNEKDKTKRSELSMIAPSDKMGLRTETKCRFVRKLLFICDFPCVDCSVHLFVYRNCVMLIENGSAPWIDECTPHVNDQFSQNQLLNDWRFSSHTGVSSNRE